MENNGIKECWKGLLTGFLCLLLLVVIGCGGGGNQYTETSTDTRFTIKHICTPAGMPDFWLVTDTNSGEEYLRDRGGGFVRLGKPLAEARK